MWAIFKVIIEFVTILLFFLFYFSGLQGMWDLSPPTRDQTHTPCLGRRSLNHWTARELPWVLFFFLSRALELTQVSQVVQPADALPTLSFKGDGKCWSCWEGEGLIVGVWVVFEGEGCLCCC